MSSSPPTFYRNLFEEVSNRWTRNNVLRLSAALSYYAVFSIAPLLIIAMSVAGWIYGPEAVRGQLDDQLRSVMGPVPAKAVQSLVQSAAEPKQGAIAAAIGFVTLLVGASGVFNQVKESLNEIWQVPASASSAGIRQMVSTFLLTRLLTFGMVLMIGFLLLVSLLLTAGLAAAEKYAGEWLPVSAQVLGTLGLLLSFLMEAVLFMLIFRVLPDVRVKWSQAWRGACVTAFLFEIGKWLLGLYLGRESTSSSYGAAGSLVLVLMWFYYTALIFFTGAVFTRSWTAAKLTETIPTAAVAEPPKETALQ
ncbi:MAG TPA: YihY/virulence factor BrkB family protein [Chthoniobacterales bacterium]|jgi:membrane protein